MTAATRMRDGARSDIQHKDIVHVLAGDVERAGRGVKSCNTGIKANADVRRYPAAATNDQRRASRLAKYLEDEACARIMQPDGSYIRIKPPAGGDGFNSQTWFIANEP